MNRLEDFKAAIDRGDIPQDTMLILDNDSVYAYAKGVEFSSDPHTLLREALDMLGLEYDEA